MKVKTAIITPDKHVPYHDRDAWNCMLKAVDIVKPDIYVDIGDFGESSSVSHWQHAIRKEKLPLDLIVEEMDVEVNMLNKYMDEVDRSLDKIKCKERIYIQGNHDRWWNDLVEKHPVLGKMVHKYGIGYYWEEIINLQKRGYKYYPYGERCLIGKLYVLHGDLYGGQYQCANHLRKIGVNCMIGHWHTIQQYSVTHFDGEKSCWCIGTLKSFKYKMANEFTKGRPKNWGHGFAIVYFFNNGLFTVNQVRIINGQCVVHGKYIDGREKKKKDKKTKEQKTAV